MSEQTLSERLKHFRIDRPSEWLMDDFIRDAKELEAQKNPPHILTLMQQVDELEAKISRVSEIPANLRDDFSRSGLPTGALEAIWYIEQALLGKEK